MKRIKIVSSILGFVCAFVSRAAETKTDEYRRAESHGIELIVRDFFLSYTLGTRDAKGNMPLHFRFQVWLKNKREEPVSLITSEKIGFLEQETLYVFHYGSDSLDGTPLRKKPSELDIVVLQPGEAVFLQQLSLRSSTDELSNKTLRFIYSIDASATRMYGVWSGEIEVPIKFGRLVPPNWPLDNKPPGKSK